MPRISRGFVFARTAQSALNKAKRENSAEFKRRNFITVEQMPSKPTKTGLCRFRVYAEPKPKKRKK